MSPSLRTVESFDSGVRQPLAASVDDRARRRAAGVGERSRPSLAISDRARPYGSRPGGRKLWG